MDKTLYLSCTVSEKGSLLTDERDEASLAARFAGKKVEVRVKSLSPKRSLAANNYYWGCLVAMLSDHTGYEKDEMHAILKARFASETNYILNEKTGELIETTVPRQTRHMTKAEFAQFVESVESLCTELGIILPAYEGDRYAYAEHD